MVKGVTLDDDGHVKKIVYLNEGLVGKLPNVFGRFANLQAVWLDDNKVSGMIPDFSACTQLEKVWLRGNH